MPERDDRKISGHTGECSPEKILRGNGGKILAANIPPFFLAGILRFHHP